jgi:hypothetical protein
MRDVSGSALDVCPGQGGHARIRGRRRAGCAVGRQPPSAISWEAIDRLPTRADWPAGATSDDTEQLVLMAGYLTELVVCLANG